MRFITLMFLMMFELLADMPEPISEWKFDGNGSNEIDGMPYAYEVQCDYVASGGVQGGYIHKPGTAGYVFIGHNEAYNLATSFTIEFWFRQYADHDEEQELMAKCNYLDSPDDSCNFRIFRVLWNAFNAGAVKAGYEAAGVQGSGWRVVTNPNELAHGVWHHVVYTKDANVSHAYYLDGKPWHQSNYKMDDAQTNTLGIVIGYTAVNTDFDEVRIYNEPLSAEEVQLRYNRFRHVLTPIYMLLFD